MAPLGRNIAISALFTLFGGPGLLLVYVPWRITHFRIPDREPLALIGAAWVLIAAGLVPLLESILRFIVVGRGTLVPTAPPAHLVMTGLYRYVRNPMYVGVLTAIAGEALLFGYRGMAVHFAVVALAMHLFVRLYEEPKLQRTFPLEYPLYRRNVRRWVPRWTPWNASPPAARSS
ncbi:MAG: isoprenylcysteine carboxylmethyltransferase family protein [Terracidiphilus sp.]